MIGPKQSLLSVTFVVGMAMLSGCAVAPIAPSITFNESIKIVTPVDGGEKQTVTKSAKIVVNGRKVLRHANGMCVVETSMLVNVAKRVVRDVEITLPKVRITRYPVACPDKTKIEALPDDVVQMDLEETWYIDQARSFTQDGDTVFAVSVTPLVVGTSVKREQAECQREVLTLESVSTRRVDEVDVVVPTTRVETTGVPCPEPYAKSR